MSSFATVHHQPYPALTNFVATKPLAGKSVIVTGASSGVGEQIARQLAAAGAKTIGIVARDKARLEAAKDRFAAEYPETEWKLFAANVIDQEAITGIFKSFGAPDILVNNAGVFPDEKPFVEEDLLRWFSDIENNILGQANVIQKFLRALGPGKPAIVLNLSSIAVHFRLPIKAWAGYNASKAFQLRFFEYLQVEHPEVRFVNIHPGVLYSDGFVKSKNPMTEDQLTNGAVTGGFFAWAATDEAEFLKNRFVWAEWDIDELKAKKEQILKEDLLLMTIEGFKDGM